MEVEAVDEGVLGKIIVSEGSENVPVNEVIGVLLEEGENAEHLTASETLASVTANAETGFRWLTLSVDTAAVAVVPSPRPEGSEMKSIGASSMLTVREALRDAAEEMRKNENVFLMGEEVAQYQGAYKSARACSMNLVMGA